MDSSLCDAMLVQTYNNLNKTSKWNGRPCTTYWCLNFYDYLGCCSVGASFSGTKRLSERGTAKYIKAFVNLKNTLHIRNTPVNFSEEYGDFLYDLGLYILNHLVWFSGRDKIPYQWIVPTFPKVLTDNIVVKDMLINDLKVYEVNKLTMYSWASIEMLSELLISDLECEINNKEGERYLLDEAMVKRLISDSFVVTFEEILGYMRSSELSRYAITKAFVYLKWASKHGLIAMFAPLEEVMSIGKVR